MSFRFEPKKGQKFNIGRTINFTVCGTLSQCTANNGGCDFINCPNYAKEMVRVRDKIDEYYNSKTKDKKLHSMRYYWVTSIIQDIFTKVLTVFASTFGIIYIVVIGSNDWNLLMLAFVNLLLFICFGLLALNNAFEFFNNKHIPYMIEKIREVNESN